MTAEYKPDKPDQLKFPREITFPRMKVGQPKSQEFLNGLMTGLAIVVCFCLISLVVLGTVWLWRWAL